MFNSSSDGMSGMRSSFVKGFSQTRHFVEGHSFKARSERTQPQVLIAENLKDF